MTNSNLPLSGRAVFSDRETGPADLARPLGGGPFPRGLPRSLPLDGPPVGLSAVLSEVELGCSILFDFSLACCVADKLSDDPSMVLVVVEVVVVVVVVIVEAVDDCLGLLYVLSLPIVVFLFLVDSK